MRSVTVTPRNKKEFDLTYYQNLVKGESLLAGRGREK
jgi:hypothetical protein